MTARINPAWKLHNDIYNEGHEGYNPHPKFVTSTGKPAPRPAHGVAAPAPAKATGRMLRDERGNIIMESALRERLAKDEARLLRLTDKFGIQIVQEAIDFARKQLGGEA